MHDACFETPRGASVRKVSRLFCDYDILGNCHIKLVIHMENNMKCDKIKIWGDLGGGVFNCVTESRFVSM